MKTRARRLAPALAAAMMLAVPLAACSGGSEDEASAPEVGNETLAAALASGDDIGMMSEAMQDTGLAQVFDGTAAYTVLAPTDTAFSALGDEATLDTEEQRAVLASILREHVLPGALSPEDITNAITVQDGAVTMRSMGENNVTFTEVNGTLQITDGDGTTAMVAGDPILASNGVVIPIDRVLKTP